MEINKMPKFENCIYNGVVFHERKSPKRHKFKYNVFYLHFDLTKINKVFRKIPILSINKFNFFSFYYNDLGPLNCKDLEHWVRSTLKINSIHEKIESIFLLTYPRFLGYVFNPLSVYTCLNKNKKIVAQIYEVHNTFGQRHFYITKNTFDKINHEKKIKKEFHVSPFMSITGSYNFKSFMTKNKLSMNIVYNGKHGNLLATFNGHKKQLSTSTLLINAFKNPFMTLKVILGIHLEAIYLFFKGLIFFKCPPVNKKIMSNNYNEK